jgi:hypothetical protein
VPLHGQATPLLIGEAKAPVAELLTQRTVFSFEVLDDLELFPVDPTGENRQDEVPRRHGDHDDTLTGLVQARGSEKAGRQTPTCSGMPRNPVDRRSDVRSGGAWAPCGIQCRIRTFDFLNITPSLMRPDNSCKPKPLRGSA